MTTTILAGKMPAFRRRRAASAIEYGLIAAGIALVAVVAISNAGKGVEGAYCRAASALASTPAGCGAATKTASTGTSSGGTSSGGTSSTGTTSSGSSTGSGTTSSSGGSSVSSCSSRGPGWNGTYPNCYYNPGSTGSGSTGTGSTGSTGSAYPAASAFAPAPTAALSCGSPSSSGSWACTDGSQTYATASQSNALADQNVVATLSPSQYSSDLAVTVTATYPNGAYSMLETAPSSYTTSSGGYYWNNSLSTAGCTATSPASLSQTMAGLNSTAASVFANSSQYTSYATGPQVARVVSCP